MPATSLLMIEPLLCCKGWCCPVHSPSFCQADREGFIDATDKVINGHDKDVA